MNIIPKAFEKDEHKISIVMPVRNGMPYLKQCINSILSQSWSNWELIIINDHSTDNTTAFLEEISNDDKRIQWHNNKGVGITPALIRASSFCSGQMITRMDADDLMPSDKLENLHKLLVSEGRQTVVTGMVEYFSDTKLGDGYIHYMNWLNKLSSSQSHYDEIFKECSVASANWLMYMNDFKDCGGFGVRMYPEDYSLLFEWRRAGYNIIAAQTTTHLWRDHPSRASRNDENYKDNSFTKMKVNFFIEQDLKRTHTLLLWGAGKKGKNIAKQLTQLNIPFRWMCNNKNKIGHEIYGIRIESINLLSKIHSCQVIVAVSQKGAETEIRKTLDAYSHKAYFFC